MSFKAIKLGLEIRPVFTDSVTNYVHVNPAFNPEKKVASELWPTQLSKKLLATCLMIKAFVASA